MSAALPPGYRIAPGQGCGPDDLTYQRARKSYPCAHKAPNAWRRLSVPCAGPVEVGDAYVRTRQSWLEWEPVNVQCLVAAGVLLPEVTP